MCLSIPQDHIDAFLEVMEDNIKFTSKEVDNHHPKLPKLSPQAGVLVYKVCQDFLQDDVYWMMEEWQTLETLRNHCASNIFKENTAR